MNRIITKRDIVAIIVTLFMLIFPAVGIAFVDFIADYLTKP